MIDSLVGAEDRSLVVTEFDGDDYELAAVVDAAQTPAFLTPFRVVVCRNLHRFKADELDPLHRYLKDPLEETSLVLLWSSGRMPKALADGLKAAGAVGVDAAPPSGKGREPWIAAAVAAAELVIDLPGRRAIAEALADDMARLSGLLATLVASFGPGARLGFDDVAPYLGESGSVPPWDLTDAIDGGDPTIALDKLHRMLRAGNRHPLQVMVTIQIHIERMLRLHGSDASDEREAAAVLGLKGSTFPARKALTRAKALGGPKIARAIELVAQADVDLRGASAWPGEQVLEVLVVRLALLGRTRRTDAVY